MKHLTLVSAVVAGMSINTAYGQEFGRIDRKIEAAAAKRAGEKIGTLRGLILADKKNLFVLPSDLKASSEGILKFSPLKQTQTAPTKIRRNSLPPIVMNNTVDPIVTGQPYSAQKIGFKFDSSGRPLKHHQEYPRPTLRSVAKSLIEAMDMNAYPGSE